MLSWRCDRQLSRCAANRGCARRIRRHVEKLRAEGAIAQRCRSGICESRHVVERVGPGLREYKREAAECCAGASREWLERRRQTIGVYEGIARAEPVYLVEVA